jgi:hypothetical protein
MEEASVFPRDDFATGSPTFGHDESSMLRPRPIQIGGGGSSGGSGERICRLPLLVEN